LLVIGLAPLYGPCSALCLSQIERQKSGGKRGGEEYPERRARHGDGTLKMRKLTLLASTALLLATFPAIAQEEGGPYGNIQRYGGHWRYQHRDWSDHHGHPYPAVCWQWDDVTGHWLWTCSG
jgi:hypothetical protein